ncbi:hypothetical protein AOL_s00110g197 [Orbilia oligospora ATCC 24927]|uniref:Uncharacterized protein n=1 Tax=Arthrobotrys oligospora (strain ATCC 24927 / CBS 115.81 / DSM 1491) TaxID=756982 RepID=G1XL27_ARTOA|nr:hypothetical protein AOL_s00110g197 [Orbilia oligospora ATCC 24927]EGX46033.1 hypothetical protein AOL_s00110g197 [Orbilia oligospora ATCC 24927]
MSDKPDYIFPSKDIITEIAKATGLPSEIWLAWDLDRIEWLPQARGYNYDLIEEPWEVTRYKFPFGEDSSYSINIGPMTTAAFSRFPAIKLLGFATLLRTPDGLTTMVSIAEAAAISMSETHCQMLWIMMQLLEKGIKADEEEKTFSPYRWYEVSEDQYSTDIDSTIGDLANSSSQKQQDNPQGSNTQESPSEIPANECSPDNTLVNSALLLFDKKKSILSSSRHADTSDFSSRLLRGSAYAYGDYSIFKRLAEWLEFHLGGTASDNKEMYSTYAQTKKTPPAVNFLGRGPFYVQRQTREQNCGGCWRNKIKSGNVQNFTRNVTYAPGLRWRLASNFNFAISKRSPLSASRYLDNHEDGSLEPCHQAADFLLLTAAALWSLFDNDLERLPNCQCTLKTSKDYIQCRGKLDGWFIWHT